MHPVASGPPVGVDPFLSDSCSLYKQMILLTPCSRLLLEKVTSSQIVKKFPHFMEPESSLPRLQELANCPYSEPYQSSPCPPSYFLNIHFNIILPSMSGSSKWSFSLRFLDRNPVRNYPLPIRATYPAHLTNDIKMFNILILKKALCGISPMQSCVSGMRLKTITHQCSKPFFLKLCSTKPSGSKRRKCVMVKEFYWWF